METLSNPRNSSPRVLVPLFLLLASCGGLYQKLLPEAEIADLADLSQSCAEMPGKLSLIQVDTVQGKPFRIAIEEKNTGNRDRVIVLIHGILANRSVWKYTVGDLGRDHDLLLVDLPGCGDSDKPNPAIVGNSFYSPDSMARKVLEALRLKLAERPAPEHLTIMAHSLGGMVTLRMLGNPDLRREYADIIELVDDLVLLSPLDISVERKYAEFERLAELNTLEMEFGEFLGLVSRKIGNATYEFSLDPTRMPREEADRLYRILKSKKTRHAAQAMIRQALPFQRNGRTDWQRVRQVESWYDSIEQPCLIIWGAQDETLSVGMGFKLQTQLPKAWLRIIEERSHALPCEAPVLCAELARRFIRDRGQVRGEDYERLAALPRQVSRYAYALLDSPGQDRHATEPADLPAETEQVQPELPASDSDSRPAPR